MTGASCRSPASGRTTWKMLCPGKQRQFARGPGGAVQHRPQGVKQRAGVLPPGQRGHMVGHVTQIVGVAQRN